MDGVIDMQENALQNSTGFSIQLSTTETYPVPKYSASSFTYRYAEKNERDVQRCAYRRKVVYAALLATSQGCSSRGYLRMTTVCGETQYMYVAEMATENWCCHTLLSSAISTTLVLEVARSTSGSNFTV